MIGIIYIVYGFMYSSLPVIYFYTVNRWLKTINEYGCCLLKNVPTEEQQIKKVSV